jgi:hypothetical protein
MRVKEDLKSLGPKVYAEKIAQISIRGTPDLFLCIRGMFFGMELKDGKEKPTRLQQYQLDKIREAGGVALVVRQSNWPEVFARLKRFAETGILSPDPRTEASRA